MAIISYQEDIGIVNDIGKYYIHQNFKNKILFIKYNNYFNKNIKTRTEIWVQKIRYFFNSYKMNYYSENDWLTILTIN